MNCFGGFGVGWIRGVRLARMLPMGVGAEHQRQHTEIAIRTPMISRRFALSPRKTTANRIESIGMPGTTSAVVQASDNRLIAPYQVSEERK